MPSLAENQHAFANALHDPCQLPPPPIAWSGERPPIERFNVYRNTLYAGLIGVIEARYPALRRILGDEFFKATAHVFVGKHPPRSPVLLSYGGDLSLFLETFEPVADEPYVADVARLEWALHEACHAADAKPLAVDALAAIPAHRVGSLTLEFAPAFRLVHSIYPVFSIWAANARHEDSEDMPRVLSGVESVMVSRTGLMPQAVRLPPGAHAFLTALAGKQSLAAAVEAALAAAPLFRTDEALALLIRCEAITAFDF